MKKYFLISLTILFYSFINGQEIASEKTRFKFGEILRSDFEVQPPVFDPGATVIIIADVGSAEFIGNANGWFNLILKRKKRIKIINEKGFDAANFKIYLYNDYSGTEKLENVKAATFNLLKDGSIKTSQVSTKDIFEEKVSKSLVEKKFTLPDINVGSIIEISYSIKSDFIFTLKPWEFQSEYPCLWSEYQISIPDFFGYTFLLQGAYPLTINKKSEQIRTYNLSESSTENMGIDIKDYQISATTHTHLWVIRDVPTYKQESFQTSPWNHISRIQFQLNENRFTNKQSSAVFASWKQTGEAIMESDEFGKAIELSSTLEVGEINAKIVEGLTERQKCKIIYESIRDNFSSIGDMGFFLKSKNECKDLLAKKNGSSALLNIFLLGQLKKYNIDAYPVLLSTRNHGFAPKEYPILDRFNYVVTFVKFSENDSVLLDPSYKKNGFGILPLKCFNGRGWVIGVKQPYPIEISADSLYEQRSTFVAIINDHGKMTGSITSNLGVYESRDLREKMNDKDLISKKPIYYKELEPFWNINSISIDSLYQFDFSIQAKIDISAVFVDDILYINPMLGEEIKLNPFKSEKRLYPIEMPYREVKYFSLDIEIPQGYKVEEIPKSVRFNLNNNDCFFEYKSLLASDRIRLKCTIKINKCIFLAEEYESLREFYTLMIKKQSEQIVLKKIK